MRTTTPTEPFNRPLSFLILWVLIGCDPTTPNYAADAECRDDSAVCKMVHDMNVDQNEDANTVDQTLTLDIAFASDQNLGDMTANRTDMMRPSAPCFRCLDFEPFVTTCDPQNVVENSVGKRQCRTGNNQIDCATVEDCCAIQRRQSDRGAQCGACLPRFEGPSCGACTDPRFTGENCDICADIRFTGIDCRQCTDPRFSPPDCDECAENFGGQDCEIEFIAIEGGTFSMGSALGDSTEQPVHTVTVPSFRMSKTEVTVKQYRHCVERGRCTPGESVWSDVYPGENDHHPVTLLTWAEAMQFAEFMGARLPTEAEWEYAARGQGGMRTYPWGDAVAPCDRYANYNNCEGTALPVCSFTEGNTVQGLCDMAGNLWEWVQDDWHASYDGAPTDGQAWIDEPERNMGRVIRGGGWFYEPEDIRVSARQSFHKAERLDTIGFRLVKAIVP